MTDNEFLDESATKLYPVCLTMPLFAQMVPTGLASPNGQQQVKPQFDFVGAAAFAYGAADYLLKERQRIKRATLAADTNRHLDHIGA